MASEHPFDRYNTALSKWEEAQAKARNLVDQVAEIARKLQDWTNVGIPDNHRILGEASRETLASKVIEAKDWPTIQAIDNALREYHEAVDVLRGAHGALSRDERRTVRPCPV